MFVAVVIAMGAGSLLFTRAQRAGFRSVVASSQVKLAALAKLQHEVLEAEVPVGGVLYQLDRSGDLNEQWVQWRSHATAVDDYFETLLELSDGRQARSLASAKAEWRTVVAGVAEARTMWGTGVVGAALAKGEDPFGPTVWASLTTLERTLASEAVTTVEMLRTEVEAASRRQLVAEALFGAAILVASAFGAISAWRLSQRVIRPLLTLRNAVERMSDGDLTGQVDLPAVAGREVAEVAEQIAQLAASLDLSQRRLHTHAYTDGLTGLANRRAFVDRLDAAFQTQGDGHTAVLLIDIDDFKYVNDSLGHQAGDQLLCDISQRLTRAARAEDTVARFGGDEFAIVVQVDDALGAGATIADRILTAMAEPFLIDGRPTRTGCSIGIADGHTAATADDLVRHADAAMYVAKSRGKNCLEVFDPTLDASMITRADLKSDLRNAASRNELELHYQPIIDLDSDEVIGFEALVRWNHPTRGLLMPAEFIDAAEESGDIVAIGSWVIDNACQELASYRDQSRSPFVSVNVSPRQLLTGTLVATVRDAITRHQIDPGSLILEITEAALLADPVQAAAVLEQLRADGVRIALDDFGTGFSSLQYLQRLPVDVIKIDRAFVTGSADDQGELILQAIVTMGHGLGLDLIAEGIEAPTELQRLRRLGPMSGQGYLIARPMHAADAAEFLHTHAAEPDGAMTTAP